MCAGGGSSRANESVTSRAQLAMLRVSSRCGVPLLSSFHLHPLLWCCFLLSFSRLSKLARVSTPPKGYIFIPVFFGCRIIFFESIEYICDIENKVETIKIILTEIQSLREVEHRVTRVQLKQSKESKHFNKSPKPIERIYDKKKGSKNPNAIYAYI